MPHQTSHLIWAIALAATALGAPQGAAGDAAAMATPPPSSAASVPTRAPAALLVEHSSGAVTDVVASSTVVTSAAVAAATTGPITLNLVNKVGSPLSIDFANNAGAPPFRGTPTAGSLGSSTQLIAPTNYAGNIGIGHNFNVNNSLFEMSYVSSSPFIDVSYVDGFSVPITCSCDGAVAAGSNINLFNDGHTCGQQTSGPVCVNPERTHPNGPASPFFSPVSACAYTYPNDNVGAYCQSHTINCCIGTNCPSNPKC